MAVTLGKIKRRRNKRTMIVIDFRACAHFLKIFPHVVIFTRTRFVDALSLQLGTSTSRRKRSGERGKSKVSGAFKYFGEWLQSYV